jgi:hypothetical protein
MGVSIYKEEDRRTKDIALVLFVVFAEIVSGGVLSFGRRRWRKATLPFGHEIRGGALEFRGGQLRDGWPWNAFGDAGVGRGGTRVPLAKARGAGVSA